MNYNELYRSAADFVADFFSPLKPEVGIVLGSGLGSLADQISDAKVLPYSRIPGFPVSTAVGHKGNLICGTLGGKTVIAMQGRFHYYEGYCMEQVTMPVRVMALIGVKTLFVSNAAGGINPDFRIGDLMIIRDHINFLPNPLIGPNKEDFGPRFPDMTRPYDGKLYQQALELGAKLGISLKEGVYAATTGPSYETPAEYKYYRFIGGDAVGMSTVPEVIVARHSGMDVFGMSVITNNASGELAEDYTNDGDEVVAAADAAAKKMTAIFNGLIELL